MQTLVNTYNEKHLHMFIFTISCSTENTGRHKQNQFLKYNGHLYKLFGITVTIQKLDYFDLK